MALIGLQVEYFLSSPIFIVNSVIAKYRNLVQGWGRQDEKERFKCLLIPLIGSSNTQ